MKGVLKVVIFGILVLSGLCSLLKVKSSGPDGGEIPRAVKKLPVTVPIGLASGLATGTTGMSGNMMISSFLIGLLDFSPYLAVGTTTLVSFAGNVLSLSALCLSRCVFHATNLHIEAETLLTLGIGSGVGALLGAKLTTKINRKVLTIILATMAVILGIYLLIKK